MQGTARPVEPAPPNEDVFDFDGDYGEEYEALAYRLIPGYRTLFPMFDETIRFAVQSTLFEPAWVNCDPVERWMTVTVPVGHVGISSYLNKDEMHMALAREYPTLLRDTGTSGTVVVLAHIDEQGVVRRTQVFTSSGHRALDQAAQQVVRIARFVPTVHEGQATSAWGTIPITFETR